VDIANEIIAIGSNFHKGDRFIGRKRLQANSVAFLGSHDALVLAIRDLHAYAIQQSRNKPNHSIVFRVVSEIERNAINTRIKNDLGITKFLENSERYCPPLGHWHLIDSESIAHAHHRHGDGGEENREGHVPLSGEDFEQIPTLVNARNIREFATKGDSARIIYRTNHGSVEVSLVQELCRKRGMIFKTMYKQKK
jgi:hypothetical protein